MSLNNSRLLEYTKDITIAKLSNSDTPTSGATGETTADFMQAIYDKLVELNSKEN